MAMAKKKSGGSAAYDKLRADLAADTLGTAYIFHGEESYLREYYLSEMKKRLVPAGFEEFNYHRLEGKGLTVQALTEAAEAMPMMAQRTMVQVVDWDLYKLSEEQRNALIALLEDFPDYCCLVLVYDQVEYKPNRTYKKLYAAVEKNVQTVKFEEQSQNEILKWVSRRFKATGHTIDAPTAEYLLFTCGSLMNGLIPEIGKIASYAKGERITKADIDAVAAPVLDVVYPPALVLICISLIMPKVHDFVSRGAVIGALLTSVLCTLHTYGVSTPLVEALPLYDLGLSWVLPAVVFGLAAQLVTMLPSVRRREEPARRVGEKN